jgi:hypothetical protein
MSVFRCYKENLPSTPECNRSPQIAHRLARLSKRSSTNINPKKSLTSAARSTIQLFLCRSDIEDLQAELDQRFKKLTSLTATKTLYFWKLYFYISNMYRHNANLDTASKLANSGLNFITQVSAWKRKHETLNNNSL